MEDAPYTDDLDLDAVCTREDLAAVLQMVHIRADQPSLRTLEARTRLHANPLSKTVVSEMLRGARFPRKAVMVAFLRACGVPDDAMEPWRRVWDRVAASEQVPARARTVHTTPSPQGDQAVAGEHLVPVTLRPSSGGTETENLLGDRSSAVDQTEINKLRERVSQLLADNDELRLQMTKNADRSSLHASAVHDPAASVSMDPHGHVIRCFPIDDRESERLFYNELETHIRNAKEAVYILGKGFHNEQSSPVYRSLIRAEREALRHGVDMLRIQTGNPVAHSWAQGYARLIKDFPDHFSMVADLDGIYHNDIILIDPRGHDPVVSFLFVTKEPGPLGPVGRPILALFILNARPLASNLADRLIDRADELPKLNSQVARNLASGYTYFAWGVHMARRKIQRDVPDARPLGKAILYEWRRDIKGMLSGPANRATIQHTGSKQDSFDGVAYELSWWGKARIDRLERRAYEEVTVTIELDGKRRRAFTYVPLPAATEKDHLARGSWIDLVVEGAVENEMTGLLAELRDGGAPINTDRF